MNSTRTVPQVSGVVAPAVAFGSILLATVLSPTFSWTMDALSELGGAGEPTAWLFNGGLVAGSLLSVLSLWAVWRTRENALDTVGCVGLTISLVAMGLVGVFPVGTDLHLPMAVTFFGAFTYALFFFGSGRVLAGEPRFGLASLWLGIAHVTSWVVWAAGL